MQMGGAWVIDADIRDFFGSLDHAKLREILSQRVGDHSMMRLIGKWLTAGVMEAGRLHRPELGTPQGGVISPLLANVYLNEVLDRWFERDVRPRLRGQGFLIRYADDFVVLAKRMGPETLEFIESRLEGKFQLEINRDKTRVVDLRAAGASLDFLGYTFRYDRDLKGRDQKYLNMIPSKKAVQREREKLHEMTNSHQCFKPIPVLIGELNRHLKGWANYFSFGYPSSVHCEIDRFVQGRLIQHLQRRSQRPYHPPSGASWSGHLVRLGLLRLAGRVHA